MKRQKVKKYEFTGETKDVGVLVRRIRRISDGVLGGWLEGEHNLSHYGSCWVGDDACVLDEAGVYDDARVEEYGWVTNHATLSGNACVSGEALVEGQARLYNNARASGNAKLTGCAILSDSACAQGDAYVDGPVGGCVCVTWNAKGQTYFGEQ